MNYFERKVNPYNINKDARYFALMHPLDLFCLTDSSVYDWVECVIVEDMYKVDDGYKVTLKPINPNYASRDFYQDTFIDCIKRGYIVEKTSDYIHIERREERIPITETVYLNNSYSIIAE